jgi:hypothetical protein
MVDGRTLPFPLQEEHVYVHLLEACQKWNRVLLATKKVVQKENVRYRLELRTTTDKGSLLFNRILPTSKIKVQIIAIVRLLQIN